ncbi:uncharacterized protein N7503_011827 [Penicillium pulvis]|uniref:uncharacterized protein n=1 Tax=Penicillium pulvis TaxID=1562058 RepID=UPI0025477B6E|nr:uncharacterized protein N7503_011827 [Penicillium pulvis]KAJ5786615.1 hypothetical protein N7503_011827 [Penicillium pulvis]
MQKEIPLQESIIQQSSCHWRLGSMMECHRVTTPDKSYTAKWKDGDSWYHIGPATAESILARAEANDFPLIHKTGNQSAVWAIGNNAICKVHPWVANMTQESEIIQFIRENAPDIPIPEVIHSWVDGDRSFLVLRRVEGTTLRDAWETMTFNQQKSMVDEVAGYCDIMASLQSERIESVQGGAIREPYLAEHPCDLLGPLTASESKKYFFRDDFQQNPKIGNSFHFYHSDLGPGNIMVHNNRVSAIIDWESAGFYPHFWISTKPSVSPGFDFDPPTPGVEDFEWRRLLRTKLQELGYPRYADWYMKWRGIES